MIAESAGFSRGEYVNNFTVQNWSYVDVDECKKDLFEVLEECVPLTQNKIGAILLECTNMCPYSDDIRELYKIPVFDFVSLVNFIHESIKASGKYRRDYR